MVGNLNSRSAYDFASPASSAICGSPAPTTVIGSLRCTVLCTAWISASSCDRLRNCSSSMSIATPRPCSSAASPIATNTSVRSIERSPWSPRPSAGGMSHETLKVPCRSTDTAKALSTSAARRARSLQRALGESRSSAAFSCENIAWRKRASSCLLASISTTSHELCACDLAELPEQHGLAHAAQPRDDHGLLGSVPLEPPQQHGERLDLVVTADDDLGRCPGVRRVRIADAVHVREFRTIALLYPVPIKHSKHPKGADRLGRRTLPARGG